MKYLLCLFILYPVNGRAQQLLADSIIKKQSIQETLRFLTNDSLRGRLAGSEGANIAAEFIASAFDSIGLNPFADRKDYFDIFPTNHSRKKIFAKNVVGLLPGKYADTMVIFSAHYDHIGKGNDMPSNKDYNSKDDIFNGANDNATGVAALLELAKYYQAQKNNLYSILFIAFSGEEMGMLGSTYFMKYINPPGVKAVINLEMLGRPQNANCFVVSFRNNSIRNILNSNLKKHQDPGEKNFFDSDPYPDENLSSRSDHYPFARKIKNAFTIMGSSPGDMYYHSVDDEFETIDVDFLLKATKNIALACGPFIK